MQMLSRKSFVGLVAAGLTLTCVGFASHKSSERKTKVTFTSTAKFNDGNSLPAGTYTMEVATDSQTPTVKFTDPLSGRVLATETAKVAAEQKKNPNTEIDSKTSGNAQLVETIRPAGWEETLMFGSSGQ